MTKNPMPQNLIDQLVNPEDASLSAGSNTPVQWRCPKDPRHIWTASPNTRKRSPNCSVCTNKTIIPGVNDLATTNPELAQQLVDSEVGTKYHAGSHHNPLWQCKNNHQWKAEIVARTKLNSGCPYCSGRMPIPGKTDLATLRPEIAKLLVNPDEAKTVTISSSKKLLWQCQENPGHQWKTEVRNRTRNKPTGCPKCIGRKPRTKTKQRLEDIDSPLIKQAVNPDKARKLTTGSGVAIEWKCNDCIIPHTYTMPVRKRIKGQRCPVKAGIQVFPGINDIATTHPNIAKQLVDPSLATKISKGNSEPIQWRCENNHIWETPTYARVAGNGCPDCRSSAPQKEIQTIMEVLLPNATIFSNDTKTLGKEIDILIPDKKLGIEYNGIFWHNEGMGKGRDYYLSKTELAEEHDFILVHIWEDDWKDRQAQIIRSLAHKTNTTARLPLVLPDFDPKASQTIYARSLKVVIPSVEQTNEFLNTNHIQGQCVSAFRIGLEDNDGDLRALLTLRSPAQASRANRPEGHWEIQRYATLGNIPGGFTRLLKHAETALKNKGETLTTWVSFSDRAITNGNMYRQAGFKLESTLAPDYKYTGASTRWSRISKESFQKKRFKSDPKLIYQEGYTETKAAEENKLLRIWDCGKDRWVKLVI